MRSARMGFPAACVMRKDRQAWWSESTQSFCARLKRPSTLFQATVHSKLIKWNQQIYCYVINLECISLGIHKFQKIVKDVSLFFSQSYEGKWFFLPWLFELFQAFIPRMFFCFLVRV